MEGEGFLLTHNRDEHSLRPKAIPPRKYQLYGHSVFYPKDPQAGGTWIATSQQFTLCLLNGAFEKHTHQPPYRQSRGLVIPDFFRFNSVYDFVQQYDFTGIEPFTLIVIDTVEKYEMTEIRWDAKHIYVEVMDTRKPHIWSSATLYSAETQHNRKHWLDEWLAQHGDYHGDEVMEFHHFGGNGDRRNDLKMNRNDEILTQCIMQIQRGQNHRFTLVFEDLLSEQTYRYCIL